MTLFYKTGITVYTLVFNVLSQKKKKKDTHLSQTININRFNNYMIFQNADVP